MILKLLYLTAFHSLSKYLLVPKKGGGNYLS